jgi:epoxyqueuosine reductase
MPNSISDAREAIRNRAGAEGFDIVRFARAEAPPGAAARLDVFLDEGRHGTMDWLARDPRRRADPIALWSDARSIIVLGFNYGPDFDPLAALSRPTRGAISAYAQGADYHDVLKKKLKSLAGFIAQTFGAEVKVFVDTAPVLEKPIAQMAGAGWQGKHTNLVSREFGSWLFLGSVFTTLDLEPDAPESDHCGQCRACLDICPTRAFPAPYQLDARRCISYLTIEHKGHIPREFLAPIGNRIYGCDDCLAVCPWNKFAKAAQEAKFRSDGRWRDAPLDRLASLDDAGFRALFRGSPIKRIGRDRFVRNVLIAIGNSNDRDLAKSAEALIDDPSPLVRAMAAWALSKLLDREDFSALAERRIAEERDAGALAEWRASSANCPSG